MCLGEVFPAAKHPPDRLLGTLSLDLLSYSRAFVCLYRPHSFSSIKKKKSLLGLLSKKESRSNDCMETE